jgi:hypothetical protein
VRADGFKIAMTACLAEHPPGPKDSRPANEATLNSDHNSGIQAPRIAHRREAPTQHAFQNELGLNCDPRGLSVH